MKTYGLIGFPLAHSFSPDFFAEKFRKEKIDAQYKLFPIQSIQEFTSLHKENNLAGLNVTIPYKQQIIPFLDELSESAQKIGAVNTIVFRNKKLVGHNTDVDGFLHTLDLLKITSGRALIFGTGGASLAIKFALKMRNIDYKIVSRMPVENSLSYNTLTEEIAQTHNIWINCTPMGTFPKVDEKLPLPYAALSKQHKVIDLVYNPTETAFLKTAKIYTPHIINGLPMLQKQAQKSWELWQV